MKRCIVCGANAEEHHIIFRSQNPSLVKSPINKINLCAKHHKGTCGPHGKYGRKKDLEYKINLQNELFEVFKEKITYEEIKNVLKINDKEMHKLLKTIKPKLEEDTFYYIKEDVIRSIMGGKLYFED